MGSSGWVATVFPEAAGALTAVTERGLDLRYVTNNSTAHREDVSERLAAAGLPAGAERVLTSGYVTGRWLRQRLPACAPVLVVGEAGLVRELKEAGLAPGQGGSRPPSREDGDPDAVAAAGAGAAAWSLCARSRRPGPAIPEAAAGRFQAVVVGMDRGFTFRSLAQAQAAIAAGACSSAPIRIPPSRPRPACYPARGRSWRRWPQPPSRSRSSWANPDWLWPRSSPSPPWCRPRRPSSWATG